MTKSKLCTYTNLTSHCNRGRSGCSITKVTVHYMCAKWTGANCADYFVTTNRSCSSNYCVGWNGDIAMSVDEDNRAWTSASAWNDNRAITIEVGNLADGSFTDNAWNSLVALCADICKRYHITPSYDGTRNATFTEHRMFASTDCPGAWMHARMPQLVAAVKAKMAESEQKVPDGGANAIYRLYSSKSHIWTASHGEAESLAQSGWSYEGVAFKSGNGANIYRLYNPNSGHHMFTAGLGEVGTLVIAGWKYEGKAFKAGSSKTVYRLYNPNTGEHIWTTGTTERDILVTAGWKLEICDWKVD